MSIILVSFDLIALSLFYKLVSSKAISREKQEKPFDSVSFDAPPSESPQSLWLINNLKIGFQDNFPVPNPIPLFYPDLVWASEQTLIITAAGCAFV